MAHCPDPPRGDGDLVADGDDFGEEQGAYVWKVRLGRGEGWAGPSMGALSGKG